MRPRVQPSAYAPARPCRTCYFCHSRVTRPRANPFQLKNNKTEDRARWEGLDWGGGQGGDERLPITSGTPSSLSRSLSSGHQRLFSLVGGPPRHCC